MITSKTSISAYLLIIKKTLRDAGIESWSIDANLIMSYVLGLTRVELVTKGERKLKEEEIKKIDELIKKRANKEPAQYIINKCEFMGLDFFVDENVLIPRPDTECILEPLVKYINENDCKNILDMCTGSGCISVSIAKYGENIERVDAVDISEDAIKIVNRNSYKNQVDEKINTIKSNMFCGLEEFEYDIIISNPPYIKREDILSLDSVVRDYEPIIALDGGIDGLDFYRIIAEKGNKYLSSKGRIYLEIGYDQKDEIIEIFSKFKFIDIIKDLQGLDRGLVFSKL